MTSVEIDLVKLQFCILFTQKMNILAPFSKKWFWNVKGRSIIYFDLSAVYKFNAKYLTKLLTLRFYNLIAVMMLRFCFIKIWATLAGWQSWVGLYNISFLNGETFFFASEKSISFVITTFIIENKISCFFNNEIHKWYHDKEDIT